MPSCRTDRRHDGNGRPLVEDERQRWDSLRELLRTTRVGPEHFQAHATLTARGTLYGGLVAAVSVLAAGQSVAEGQAPHSLHAYFLRRADTTPTLDIMVRRVRDGRSFAVREILVRQGERVIFTANLSFHRPEPGDDWSAVQGAPHPGPGGGTTARPTQNLDETARPFELQHMGTVQPDGFTPLHPTWLRHRDRLPGDPLWQAAALAYVSDLGVVMDARPPGSTLPQDFIGSSLDHAVWFHRPARADDWLLFESDPLSTCGGRALAQARMRDASGNLVATVLQEGLHRRR